MYENLYQFLASALEKRAAVKHDPRHAPQVPYKTPNESIKLVSGHQLFIARPSGEAYLNGVLIAKDGEGLVYSHEFNFAILDGSGDVFTIAAVPF